MVHLGVKFHIMRDLRNISAFERFWCKKGLSRYRWPEYFCSNYRYNTLYWFKINLFWPWVWHPAASISADSGFLHFARITNPRESCRSCNFTIAASHPHQSSTAQNEWTTSRPTVQFVLMLRCTSISFVTLQNICFITMRLVHFGFLSTLHILFHIFIVAMLLYLYRELKNAKKSQIFILMPTDKKCVP